MDRDQLLGGYRLIRRLGTGGAGTVWLAEDGAGRRVALKLVHPALAATEEARIRLSREATTVNRVRSPGVAHVVDIEVDASQPFVVSEFIDGPTLAVRLRSGPLPSRDVAALGEALCHILQAVHAAHIVHRDVKPANVILHPTGPVLIDFGIAMGEDDDRLTDLGLVSGTAGFAAPELLRGGEADAATDWWAWAATLLEAATARPPFGGGDQGAVMLRVMEGRPDVSGLPGPVAGVLARALAVDPAIRPAPEEVSGVLSDPAAWQGEPVGVRPAPAHDPVGATEVLHPAAAGSGPTAAATSRPGAAATEGPAEDAGVDAVAGSGATEVLGVGGSGATEGLGDQERPHAVSGVQDDGGPRGERATEVLPTRVPGTPAAVTGPAVPGRSPEGPSYGVGTLPETRALPTVDAQPWERPAAPPPAMPAPAAPSSVMPAPAAPSSAVPAPAAPSSAMPAPAGTWNVDRGPVPWDGFGRAGGAPGQWPGTAGPTWLPVVPYQARRPRRTPVVGLVLMAALAAMPVVAGAVGSVATLAVLLVLSSLGAGWTWRERRRSRAGAPRPSDTAMAAAATPLHVVRSAAEVALGTSIGLVLAAAAWLAVRVLADPGPEVGWPLEVLTGPGLAGADAQALDPVLQPLLWGLVVLALVVGWSMPTSADLRDGTALVVRIALGPRWSRLVFCVIVAVVLVATWLITTGGPPASV